MAAFSGTAGSVTFSYDGITPQTIILGVSEWSLDASMSPVETTTFGDTADNYTPSIRNFTGSFTASRDFSDSTGQEQLNTEFLTGSNIIIRFYEPSNYKWVGTVIVTGFSNSIGVKGKGEISYNFQNVGALVYN